MSLTLEQSHFLQNLCLQLIDLSRRLEQDVDEDVAGYVLFRLQQASNHLSGLAASVDLCQDTRQPESVLKAKNAVAIWPAAGQGCKNTKWPAVRDFSKNCRIKEPWLNQTMVCRLGKGKRS